MERSPQELRSRLIVWVTDWARAQEQPASMGRDVATSRVKTRAALLPHSSVRRGDARLRREDAPC